MLAYEQTVDEMGPHGFSVAEATDPANQFEFVADLPTTDWAAKAIGDKQDQFYKDFPDTPRHGHLWSVRRREHPTPSGGNS